MYILWSNDRFGLNDPLLVTFTRTMPFSFSHVFKTLLQNKVVYLPLKLLCSICLFFQKETNPEKYSHNITLSVCRHKSLQWISGYGVGYSSPQRCDKHHRRRTLALKSTDKFRIITNPHHFIPTHALNIPTLSQTPLIGCGYILNDTTKENSPFVKGQTKTIYVRYEKKRN